MLCPLLCSLPRGEDLHILPVPLLDSNLTIPFAPLEADSLRAVPFASTIAASLCAGLYATDRADRHTSTSFVPFVHPRGPPDTTPRYQGDSVR